MSNANLASTLRISTNTLDAMVESFVFDFVGHRESPLSAFNAADVAFALDGDVAVWEAILLNEAMRGALVGVGRGFYKVADY